MESSRQEAAHRALPGERLGSKGAEKRVALDGHLRKVTAYAGVEDELVWRVVLLSCGSSALLRIVKAADRQIHTCTLGSLLSAMITGIASSMIACQKSLPPPRNARRVIGFCVRVPDV